MKFTCKSDLLIKAVNTVEAIAASKLSMPIVENILIGVDEKGTFSAISTNLTMSVKWEGEAQVEEAGEIAVSARILRDSVNHLPSETEVNIEVKDNLMHIKGGIIDYDLAGIPAEQFPPFVVDLEGVEWSVPAKDLREGFDKTLCAVAVEPARYVLDGVHIDIEESRMIMVGTDTRRMALWEKEYENIDKDKKISLMVPTKTATEIKRTLAGEGEVKIVADKTRMVVYGGNVIITSTLLPDNFPPYRQVIPKKYKINAKVDRKKLLNLITSVAVMSDENSSRIDFTWNENKLLLSGQRQEVGSAVAEMGVEYNAEELTAGYNWHFWADALKVMEGDEIVVNMNQRKTAVVLKGSEEEFVYLLMPMSREGEEEDQ